MYAYQANRKSDQVMSSRNMNPRFPSVRSPQNFSMQPRGNPTPSRFSGERMQEFRFQENKSIDSRNFATENHIRQNIPRPQNFTMLPPGHGTPSRFQENRSMGFNISVKNPVGYNIARPQNFTVQPPGQATPSRFREDRSNFGVDNAIRYNNISENTGNHDNSFMQPPQNRNANATNSKRFCYKNQSKSNTPQSVANYSDVSSTGKESDKTQAVMPNAPSVGKSVQEKVRLLYGTIERIIKWNRLYKDNLCYYSIVGSVISLQEGSVRLQKVMLLRNNKGPILQVVYYPTTHITIEDFHFGQQLRCVGRMIGYNKMTAIKIIAATDEDINYLQRHCYIGDHAIANALKSK